jgi:serine phosphatase RsbU (regulator of sigma subunit)
MPAERTTTTTPPDAAFSDLRYALYVGRAPRDASLLFASTDELPLHGRVDHESIKFGDTSLLVAMSPTGHLAGGLLAALPWIVLLLGLPSTIGGCAITESLHRRRERAEVLAAENARLYAEQRAIAHELQRSLLPRTLPRIAGVELGVRYAPGVTGTDIGGDWYDVVRYDDRLVLSMGDVSGRGLDAASVMASYRHRIRALAAQGDEPHEILGKLAAIEDSDHDGHFATVLCGVIDLPMRIATFANAGHPPPLFVTEGEARYLAVRPGPPVGVAPGATYESLTVSVPPATTILLVTDGLFERRGESVEDGLARLRTAAADASGDLDSVLDTIVRELIPDDSGDDAAVLGVRWST